MRCAPSTSEPGSGRRGFGERRVSQRPKDSGGRQGLPGARRFRRRERGVPRALPELSPGENGARGGVPPCLLCSYLPGISKFVGFPSRKWNLHRGGARANARGRKWRRGHGAQVRAAQLVQNWPLIGGTVVIIRRVLRVGFRAGGRVGSSQRSNVTPVKGLRCEQECGAASGAGSVGRKGCESGSRAAGCPFEGEQVVRDHRRCFAEAVSRANPTCWRGPDSDQRVARIPQAIGARTVRIL